MGVREFSRRVGNTPQGALMSQTFTPSRASSTTVTDVFAPAGMRARIRAMSGEFWNSGSTVIQIVKLGHTNGDVILTYTTAAGKKIIAEGRSLVEYLGANVLKFDTDFEFDDTIGLRVTQTSNTVNPIQGPITLLLEVFPKYD